MKKHETMQLDIYMMRCNPMDGGPPILPVEDTEARFRWDYDLLKSGWDSGEITAHQLNEAAFCGNFLAVDFLLRKKSHCDSSDSLNMTALHYAAWRGFGMIVELLLLFGSDVNHLSSGLITPLMRAVQMNRVEIALRLLQVPNIDVHRKSSKGLTALHLACGIGSQVLVEALLDRGAPINSRTVDLTTPLLHAIENRQESVVQCLVSRDANVNYGNKMRFTPLHSVAQNGFSNEVIEILIRKSVNVNARTVKNFIPLHYAVMEGHIDMVNHLINGGAAVDACTSTGLTPLHLLTTKPMDERRRCIVARILLEKHANVNSRCYANLAPIHLAAANAQTELMTMLLDIGKAKMDQGAPNTTTALHTLMLCGKASTDAVKVLLRRGADPNATDALKRTPLHLAAGRANVDVVMLLLKNSAFFDAEADTAAFDLPLECALHNPNPDVLDLLKTVKRFYLDIGNDNIVSLQWSLQKYPFLVHCKSVRFYSPLHVATIRGLARVVRLLIEHGAPMNGANWNRPSPLHFAIKYYKPDVAFELLMHGAFFDSICPVSGKSPRYVLRNEDLKDCGGIVYLLQLAERMFDGVESGDLDVIEELRTMRKSRYGTLSILRCIRNYKGVNLFEMAAQNQLDDIAFWLG